MSVLIIKGNIVFAPVFGELHSVENGYIVCINGRIEGVYSSLPAQFSGASVEDYSDKLVIPSFTDMHLHGPQYAMLGMGMDLQLLDWLNTHTFPTEAQFADTEYARMVYKKLAANLIKVGTTRVCMYASIHRQSTHILMEELDRAGVTGYVGKVNMDRNSPNYLLENTNQSISETILWLNECEGRYENIHPMITPRFTPSCTDELMQSLGEIAYKRGLLVQSHLSENLDEIAWVKALCPNCSSYWETYERFGLFGNKTVMAHCVYSDEDERKAILKNGVWVAHCPDSNINIASGIAPIRRMLKEGLHVTLGSDIAGGAHLSMMDVATAAIRSSKRHWLDTGKQEDFLTVAEAFYLITSAGQEYFGSGPGFEAGDMLHALILDDSSLLPQAELTPKERLERLMYLSQGNCIVARYSQGKLVG